MINLIVLCYKVLGINSKQLTKLILFYPAEPDFVALLFILLGLWLLT